MVSRTKTRLRKAEWYFVRNTNRSITSLHLNMEKELKKIIDKIKELLHENEGNILSKSLIQEILSKL